MKQTENEQKNGRLSSTNISIIILNANELDTPIKRQKHDSIVSERNFKYNYIVEVEIKRMEKIY